MNMPVEGFLNVRDIFDLSDPSDGDLLPLLQIRFVRHGLLSTTQKDTSNEQVAAQSQVASESEFGFRVSPESSPRPLYYTDFTSVAPLLKHTRIYIID